MRLATVVLAAALSVGPAAAGQGAPPEATSAPAARTPVAAFPGAPAVRLPPGTLRLRAAALATWPRRLPETPAGRLEAAFVTPLPAGSEAAGGLATPGARAILRAFEAAGHRVAHLRPAGAGDAGPPARALVVPPDGGAGRWLAFDPVAGALRWASVRPAAAGPP